MLKLKIIDTRNKLKDTKYLQNIAFSLAIMYIWILYVFFDFYDALQYSLAKLTLYFNFINGMFISIGVGLFLLILRITVFRMKNTEKLKRSFFYIFSALFNLNIGILLLVSLFMKIIDVNSKIFVFLFISFLISTLIFFDLFSSNPKRG